MKIRRIFAENTLLAVVKDGHKRDEFSKCFDFWNNSEMLRNYFKENPAVLDHYGMTINESVRKTTAAAQKLTRVLKGNKHNLNAIFEPLQESTTLSHLPLQKTKAKEDWLRLYAIKISNNVYVITGGTIKQSQTMQGHPDTREQLRNLELVRNLLVEEGVYDKNSLLEIYHIDV